ncbi:MAG TPA: phospholipid carrier-dependent glycosyltransferase [Actinomycetota bacterium]|nr:phospholipid carrier-dependent glycosyltransferase [Actinomycetota bacterium]
MTKVSRSQEAIAILTEFHSAEENPIEASTTSVTSGAPEAPIVDGKTSGPTSQKSSGLARADILILLLLLIVAGSLRLVRLGEPEAVVFDETYYAKDACLYLGYQQDFCDLNQSTEQSYVHPPLGKWLIAIGIKVFGYNSFGWRASAAFFGILVVLLTYLLALKLLNDRWVGGVAGLLVATDFLMLVQSRIAMLDIFQAFFLVLGFLFLAVDRERVIEIRNHSLEDRDTPAPAREPEWGFAAGAAMGLAVSVKWSAAWGLIAVMVLSAMWSLTIASLKKKHPASFSESQRNGLAVWGMWLLSFALIPLVVYLSTYALYFFDNAREECNFTVPAQGGLKFGKQKGECVPGAVGSAMGFVDLQYRAAKYHLTLKAKHSYQSRAWTWPLVKRPVAYYYPANQKKSTHILAFGNLAVWYGSLIALVYLAIRSRRRLRPERIILAGWGSQYLPWLIVGRPLFFFYMTPVVPFMMIGLAAALGALRDKGKSARWLVTAYLILGVGVLVYFFYPVIAAVPLDYNLWRSRMWFGSWI